MARLVFAWVVLLGSDAFSQAPVLAPTASTTIDVDPTLGRFTYASIAIPAGVVVRFAGSHPVQIEVLGDVRIDGELAVVGDGDPVAPGGPGAVTNGAGTHGFYSWVPGSGIWPQSWTPGFYSGIPATSGRHAPHYGSAIPFDLAGGSPGGGVVFQPYFGMYETQYGGFHPGGGGGGTLVVEARGRIDVFGAVNADGLPRTHGNAGDGSGGSVLLRGLAGCRIASGGRVSAMPAGIVRLDAYDTAPQIAGLVQPPPTIVRLPDLTETAPPVIGTNWQLRVAAPRGDAVFLAASFQPGSGSTPYGSVGIHLATAITFAVVVMPTTGADPLGTFALPVPNDAGLIGLNLWVQGLNWFTAHPPRYTQTVQTIAR